MYFLIGLGIIVAIIYANMLYDRIREKKSNKADNVEKMTETANASSVSTEAAEGQKIGGSSQTLNQNQAGVDGSLVQANGAFSGPTLAEMIAGDLRQKKNIFGLPLTLCESEKGKLIAMDREDNIYVIETVQRPEYEEFYLQVLDDMATERKRIQKNAAARKVYAIVCVATLPETLKLAAEKENSIRIFSYELNFRNIM